MANGPGGVSPVDLDGELQRAREAIRALKRAPPGETREQARQRSCEMIEAQRRLAAAARKTVTDAVATKRVPAKNGLGDAAALDDKLPKGREIISQGEIMALAKGLVSFLREDILPPIEARLAALEAVPQLTDAGTWKTGTVFKPGQVVTHDGGAWVCKGLNSNSRPGQNGSCWRLMVKSGRK